MSNTIKNTTSTLGSKRVRDSTGSGGENVHKRPKIKERSAYLLLITKGGEEYDHLTKDEVQAIKKEMISAIYSDDVDPLIDWLRFVNQ